MVFDTIAAISTGYMNQAISIIRISGPQSFEIIKKITKIKKITPRKIIFTSVIDNNQLIDQVVAIPFSSPASYTGEDVIEINAHGGVVVTQRILKLCLKYGARLAEPGEFSRRAFLNGKINLIEAEGINNLIHAQSISQAKIAVKNLEGKSSEIILAIKEKLMNLIGIIETNIDYPEYEDIEDLTSKTLLPKLIDLKDHIVKTINSSVLTNKLYEGIKVAIVGKANAGKSTLLNSLLGESKAIVSSIPGTTRDVVEGNIEIDGVLYHFFDTAGLRKSNNQIENLGIEKTKEKIKTADLIIFLKDPTQIHNDNDFDLLSNKEYVIINSKSDIKKVDGHSINSKDINSLLDILKSKFSTLNLNNIEVLISARQQALLDNSLVFINEAIEGLNQGNTPDVVIVDIRNAWEAIANILGQINDENLLDNIFKSFCLGK